MRSVACWLAMVIGWIGLEGTVVAGQTTSATPPQAKSSIEQPASSATTNGHNPVPALLAALALFRSGKFADAESAYNEILKSNPSSTSALVGLTRLQIMERRLADASASLARVVALDPASDEVQTAQGELYFRQARLPEAEQIFTALVRKGTTQARAYLGLGNIYWATSTYQHGKLMLDKAHDADPDDPEIRRRWLGTLTRKERIKQLKEYLADESDDDSEHREHLRTDLVTMEESEEAARQGCRIASNTSELHLKMAQVMYDAKRIRGYGLRTEVNGVRGTFLIDTGAPGLLINRKIAQKAGIQPIVKTDVHGIGDKGLTSSYIGVADSIRIGDLEFQGCHVEVMDANSVAEGDGLIGTDISPIFW
jgi:tetratricopeptide (TPR) repeat protein